MGSAEASYMDAVILSQSPVPAPAAPPHTPGRPHTAQLQEESLPGGGDYKAVPHTAGGQALSWGL